MEVSKSAYKRLKEMNEFYRTGSDLHHIPTDIKLCKIYECVDGGMEWKIEKGENMH